MKTRRSALSYLTGSAVAVGAIIATGGLMRSCAPISQRFTDVDFSDMEDGELRGYVIAGAPVILIRQDDGFIAYDGRCPNGFGWILMHDTSLNAFYCSHYTRRYNRQGRITDRAGHLTQERWGKDLVSMNLNFNGTTLMVAEDETLPRQTWSSL